MSQAELIELNESEHSLTSTKRFYHRPVTCGRLTTTEWTLPTALVRPTKAAGSGCGVRRGRWRPQRRHAQVQAGDVLKERSHGAG
jgi:hypothetical protein